MTSAKHLQQEIRALTHERDAVILAHNYQSPEVQDVADYVGDSFGLSQQAQRSDAQVVLVCGVLFMAETVAVLNPTKRVLIPDPTARCPLASQLPAQIVRKAKAEHPGVPVVLYINTTAEAKAEADVVCTSSNLCQILKALDAATVLFGPDGNMAEYATHICKQHVIPIPEHGFCPVHETFSFDPHISQLRAQYPKAKLLVHPECDWELQAQADFIGSTGQMLTFARNSSATTFIIATEVDLINRLHRELPQKTFLPALEYAKCKQMKKVTLEKVKASLEQNQHVVWVPERVARPARKALQRMLDLTATGKTTSG
jgi:quinolinate synthase